MCNLLETDTGLGREHIPPTNISDRHVLRRGWEAKFQVGALTSSSQTHQQHHQERSVVDPEVASLKF